MGIGRHRTRSTGVVIPLFHHSIPLFHSTVPNKDTQKGKGTREKHHNIEMDVSCDFSPVADVASTVANVEVGMAIEIARQT